MKTDAALTTATNTKAAGEGQTEILSIARIVVTITQMCLGALENFNSLSRTDVRRTEEEPQKGLTHATLDLDP